jgi:hypothetical protein
VAGSIELFEYQIKSGMIGVIKKQTADPYDHYFIFLKTAWVHGSSGRQRGLYAGKYESGEIMIERQSRGM